MLRLVGATKTGLSPTLVDVSVRDEPEEPTVEASPETPGLTIVPVLSLMVTELYPSTCTKTPASSWSIVLVATPGLPRLAMNASLGMAFPDIVFPRPRSKRNELLLTKVLPAITFWS